MIIPKPLLFCCFTNDRCRHGTLENASTQKIAQTQLPADKMELKNMHEQISYYSHSELESEIDLPRYPRRALESKTVQSESL